MSEEDDNVFGKTSDALSLKFFGRKSGKFFSEFTLPMLVIRDYVLEP